jgi:hypothetical protein
LFNGTVIIPTNLCNHYKNHQNLSTETDVDTISLKNKRKLEVYPNTDKKSMIEMGADLNTIWDKKIDLHLNMGLKWYWITQDMPFSVIVENNKQQLSYTTSTIINIVNISMQ